MVNRNGLYDKYEIAERDRVALDRVLDAVDVAGLVYSCVLSREDGKEVSVVLNGSYIPKKAFEVKGFDEAMDKGNRNLLDGRRFLLNYVTDELRKQGAEVLERKRNEESNSFYGDVHKIRLENSTVKLYLIR